MKQKLMINYLGLFALANFSPKFFKLCWWLFSIEPLSFLFLLLSLHKEKKGKEKKKKKEALFSIGTSPFTIKHHSTITCFFLALCHRREYHHSFSGGETKAKTCTIPGNVTPWWKQRQMQGFKIPVFRLLESFHYISFSKVIMWSLFSGKKKKKLTLFYFDPLFRHK